MQLLNDQTISIPPCHFDTAKGEFVLPFPETADPKFVTTSRFFSSANLADHRQRRNSFNIKTLQSVPIWHEAQSRNRLDLNRQALTIFRTNLCRNNNQTLQEPI
jgi:hypothetical protein